MLTIGDLVEATERIPSAVNIPLIIDTDDEYGESSVVVCRSIRCLVCAGAQAATIDDFIGYGLFTAAITIFAGYSVPQELRMGVMARILVFTGTGEFVSAFVLSFIKNQVFHSTNERFSYIFSCACLIMLAVFFLLKPKSAKSAEAD